MKKAIKIILIVFLLTSCGARKVEKSKVETEKEVDIGIIEIAKVNTNTTIETTTTETDSSTIETTTITPIDPKIVATITENGKTIDLTNSILVKKKERLNNLKIKKNNKAITLNSIGTKNTDIKANESVKQSNKQVERKESFWYLWLILIIIVVGLIYYNFKTIFR